MGNEFTQLPAFGGKIISVIIPRNLDQLIFNASPQQIPSQSILYLEQQYMAVSDPGSNGVAVADNINAAIL